MDDRERWRTGRLTDCVDEMNRLARMWTERAQSERREEQQALAELARADDAPQELRRLQWQIDGGELTWHGALTGDADDVLDKRSREFLTDRFAELSRLGGAWQAEHQDGGAAR